MDFRNLRPDEIELRVGTVKAPKGNSKGGFSLLLYQNARCGMNILDETVGAENWQNEYYEVKGNLFCRVGIKFADEWIWKSDCGTESNTEKEKGEASDAFKRAVVRFGIGRELYTSPFIWIVCDESFFNGEKLSFKAQKMINGFKVKTIGYVGKTIENLIIVDKDNSIVWNS